MGLFSIKKVKPKQRQETFAVEHQPQEEEPEQQDTMEVENEDERIMGEY